MVEERKLMLVVDAFCDVISGHDRLATSSNTRGDDNDLSAWAEAMTRWAEKREAEAFHLLEEKRMVLRGILAEIAEREALLANLASF